MNEFKSICVLGRQPKIGLAELESLFGSEQLEPFGDHAILKIPAEEIPFNRLGGTLKTARILTQLPSSKWPNIEKYLVLNIPKHLKDLPEGKFTLGLSVYGLKVDASQINKTNLKLKKIIKSSGRGIRVIPNKEPALNSAQVLHNKLTYTGSWELIVISNGKNIYLAQTLFVQDIESYAARDQARPKRDIVVGMLPPKLAQIIINLAVGQDVKSIQRLPPNPQPLTVYDPFCGTGVILQEAVLMGYNALGSDIQTKMVEYTKANMDWLKNEYPKIIGQAVELKVLDATQQNTGNDYDTIASEVYLGPVLKGRANQASIDEAIKITNGLLFKFLSNLDIKKGVQFCLAVPAWQFNDEFIHLSLLDQLTNLGYNRVSFVHAGAEELIYHRPNQAVARELVVLKKI